MTRAVLIAVLVFAAAPASAQAPAPASAPAPTTSARGQEEREVVIEGELENYIAIGGESTGWRVRRRTAQGRREYIEVLLTAEVAQGVRANTRVQVRGTMQTRHYPERGDVQVLAAKSVIEVARTR